MLHTDRAIIGLCHFKALPGDPFYDEEGGMEAVYEAAYKDVMALQEGGIDAIQFTNEFSMPYSMKTVDTTTVASMAALIGRLKEHMTVPLEQIVLVMHCLLSVCAVQQGLSLREEHSMEHGQLITDSKRESVIKFTV